MFSFWTAFWVGAPLLRYAHARAEMLGRKVHYSQQNAESLDFADGSFDLSPSLTPELAALLFDPQTSGGLLAAIEPSQADAAQRALPSGFDRAAGQVGEQLGRHVGAGGVMEGLAIEAEDGATATNAQRDYEQARTYGGHGADTDIIVASAKAYLNALNKLIIAQTEGREPMHENHTHGVMLG